MKITFTNLGLVAGGVLAFAIWGLTYRSFHPVIAQQPQLAVKILKPVKGENFNLGEKVVFQGSADDVIEGVRLIADNQFPLSEVAVVNGQWMTSHQFNKVGNRKITAEGFATSGRTLTQAIVEIVIKSLALSVSCSKNQLFVIDGRKVWKRPGQSTFFYKAGMSIDADGAPNTYHPQDKGIDFLANAGKPGNWFAIVTDNGKPNGNPIIQGANDLAPGFFVSTTALEDTTQKRTNPRRYVDGMKVPYVVLPGNPLIKNTGVKLGDFVVIFNGKNGKLVNAIYADVGPKNELGEGSVALSQALGHDPFVNGKVQKGISKDIFYIVFPGSGNGKPRLLEDINSIGTKRFQDWGGISQAKACFEETP